MTTGDFASRRLALLKLLRELSYEERPVTLSSGQASHFYIDCKQTALTGQGHILIGACFTELLAQADGDRPHAAVGGLTMGADPLASATALWATHHGRPLDAIYVRKEAKGHGTDAWLEGTKHVPAGARVAIVEDVITTGKASKTAVERLRDHGFVVDTVLALVDRGAGGAEALAALGLKVHALFTVADFPAGQP